MPKSTDILTGWVDVPSPVEIARSNMVAKKKISVIEKSLKIRQILQTFSGIVVEKLPKSESFLHQLS